MELMNTKDYLKWLTTRWWFIGILLINLGAGLNSNPQTDYYGFFGYTLGNLIGTYLFLIFIIMSFRYLYLKISKKSSS